VKIPFVVTIRTKGRVALGMVPNSYIRLCEGDVEVARYNLENMQTTAKSVMFGELRRNDSERHRENETEWTFLAQAQPFLGGLDALCQSVGIMTL